jgi:hypothetical protein
MHDPRAWGRQRDRPGGGPHRGKAAAGEGWAASSGLGQPRRLASSVCWPP